MAEEPVRFGIMGCAKIAKKVAKAIDLAPNATLCAIASRSLDKAKQFAATNELGSNLKIYGSYEELANDPFVEVVYMPLPTSLHVKWAVMVAMKKKHLLVEKPVALDVDELDQILDACESNAVQFMDGSMWLHHPRTVVIKDLLSHPNRIGHLHFIDSTSTFLAPPEFLENDIRLKANMDGLGALGDLGWYCIGSILWAKNYKLPDSVIALPDVAKNSAGVLLSCSASLHYETDRTVAMIYCSFLSHSSMDLKLVGVNGTVSLNDFIIPFEEDHACFDLTLFAKFIDLHIGWNVKPEKVVVAHELPQEALMVQQLASLVQGIRKSVDCLDRKWPEMSRKTQLVLDAVKKSIDIGCKQVYL